MGSTHPGCPEVSVHHMPTLDQEMGDRLLLKRPLANGREMTAGVGSGETLSTPRPTLHPSSPRVEESAAVTTQGDLTLPAGPALGHTC